MASNEAGRSDQRRHEVRSVELRGMVEVRIPGAAAAPVTSTFSHDGRTVTVPGFVDGDDAVARFMPDGVGQWSYRLTCAGHVQAGTFDCVPPGPSNHGPVQVADQDRFQYADGTAFAPYGTTCYAWIHQPERVRAATLTALAASPFNKIRMCVFPKNYAFNEAEPQRLPFPRDAAGRIEVNRPDPEFFATLDRAVQALQELGIECDLILFHPYDKGRWGFDSMSAADDERYLRYIIARYAAYRNVWWSLANEYDFMTKVTSDWDRAIAVVHEADPYGHLASIHNGTRMHDPSSLALYDHTRPALSHVSLQHWDCQQMRQWRGQWGKPVVVDECGYEGDLPSRWGDLTAEQVVENTWVGTVLGGHVGHGETFLADDGVIWWSHGGTLRGLSPARIAFLRDTIARLPSDSGVLDQQYDVPTFGVPGAAYLQYFGSHRPRYRFIDLAEDGDFRIEVLDTWAMTSTPVPGVHRGRTRVELPARPYQAILALRA